MSEHIDKPPSVADPGVPAEEVSSTGRDRRRIIVGGGIGTVLEFYDFGIYGYLAVVLAAEMFPSDDPAAALLSTLATFAVAFLVRPIGGILFGHIGDKLSRKQALALSILGMAGSTFLIGVLPTYVAVGVLAPLLLVVLRVIQGLSAGGEIGGAVSMISESVERDRRGFWCSLAQSGSLIGLLGASAVVGLLNLMLTHQQVVAWGWRIPFWIALPTGLVGLYVRSRLEESEIFIQSKRAGETPKVPIVEVFKSSKVAVVRAFGIAAVDFAAYYVVFVYLSIYMVTELGISKSTAQWSTSATIAIAMLTLPLAGHLSDRIGRKKVIAGVTLALIVLPLPLFAAMNTGSLAVAILAQVVLGLCVAGIMGVIWAALAELFGTGVRFSGMALGFNLAAAIVGGLTPYVSQWLIGGTGTTLAPSFWLIAVAIVTLVTTLTMRETSNVSLHSRSVRVGAVGR